MAGSLGLSSLVCLLNNGDDGQTETDASLLGPFWRMQLAADAQRRLHRALADAGAGAVRGGLVQGPAGPPDRGRGGRHLAVLARRLLREPGPRPGRHEPARQAHDRRARDTSLPQRASRPAIRFPSAGRSASCCAPRDGTTCAPRICISWPPSTGFKTLISQIYVERRPVSRVRRAVRRHAPPDRQLCAPRKRDAAGSRREGAVVHAGRAPS